MEAIAVITFGVLFVVVMIVLDYWMAYNVRRSGALPWGDEAKKADSVEVLIDLLGGVFFKSVHNMRWRLLTLQWWLKKERDKP